MKKARIILIFTLVLLLGVVVFAGQKSEEVSIEKDITEGKTAVTKIADAFALLKPQVETQVAGNINLLTGMPDLTPEAVGKRPVAVMVNNVEKAFPQYGIEEADVIFEIPVEGGDTRFMALYGDYTTMPEICAIRSCRPYFPAFSEGFDAVYVNWGMMDEVREYVNTLGLTHYEGLYNAGGLFSRDEDRRDAGYALEHTGVFDGTRLDEDLLENNHRIDIESDKTDTAFRFAAINEVLTPTADACTKVDVDFGLAEATLKYEESTKKYFKEYNSKPQIDGRTGNQLSFTNVLVLEANIKLAENEIHRDVNWHGGNGYFVSNGAMQKIKWFKKSESSRLMLYDEDGNELILNRGKTYIAVNYIGDARFE